MSEKKAKAIRRSVRKTHGRTKSLSTKVVEVPTIRIFTLGKFYRAVKNGVAEKQAKAKEMRMYLPFEILVRRVIAELPEVGTMYRARTDHKEVRVDDARKAYRNEKKLNAALPKKQRAGRYV